MSFAKGLIRLTFCRCVLFVVMATSPATLGACNIPVFRYALERWRSDALEMLVFHSSALDSPQSAWVASVTQRGIQHDGAMNLLVETIDTSSSGVLEKLNPIQRQIADRVIDSARADVPYVVLRRRTVGDGPAIIWQASLDESMHAGLFSSPARTKIQQGLLAGDAIVWLVVESEDKQRNREINNLLSKQFETLAERIKLPEGIGLPGSELASEVPLLLQYSIVSISANDPRETCLLRQLRDRLGVIQTTDQALVVPIFGRARALEIVPFADVTPELVQGLTRFLCGACSCQVKELNPGFDLLIGTDWDQELFGDSPPPPDAPLHQKSDLPPLTIPPGKD